MKSVCAIAAVAGLAASVSAQPFTVEFTASETTVTENATVTWTMTVSWTGWFEDTYFAVVNGHVIGLGTAEGLATPMSGIDWGNPSLGAVLTGTPSGTSLLDIFAAQHAIFGSVVTGQPFIIGSFDVTYTAKGDASYGVADRNSNVAFALVVDCGWDPPPCAGWRSDEVRLLSDVVTVTPAPSVLSLLGMGGLVASRRRRGASGGQGAHR